MIRKGTYVLFFTVASDVSLRIGSLGDVRILSGEYCYVGSAMNGIDQRVGRHMSKDKKIRWHIDYLTVISEKVHAYESFPDPIPECRLVHLAVSAGAVPVLPGFGCSDCDCSTHLFRVSEQSKDRIAAAEGLSPYCQETAPEHKPYKI